MRLFFKKLLVNFLIVFAILSLVLFYSYSKYFETRVPYIKYNIFHDNIKPTDTISLILGSSHTFHGIDSKLINGKAFNFASVSQSLMEDYTILRHCKNPIKRVIIPVSYFTNWHYLHKTLIGGEKLRTFDYQYVYGIDYPSYLTPKDLVIFISELTKSLTKIEKVGLDDFGNEIGNCDSKLSEILDAKEAFNRHNLGKNFKVLNPYLDSIYAYCETNKIDLYITVMPYSHEYRKYTSKAGFDTYLKELYRKYNKEKSFVFDFRRFFELNEEKIMFMDADHLSYCGREKFSKFLNDQIISTSSKSKP